MDEEGRAAWEDAFRETQRPFPPMPQDERPSAYGTVLAISFCLTLVWAIYHWIPAS